MKIRELLNEALKFKQIHYKLIESKAPEFKIGIEYEFHINDEYLEAGENYDDEGEFDSEAYNEALDREVERIMDDLHMKLDEIYNDNLQDIVDGALWVDYISSDHDIDTVIDGIKNVIRRSHGGEDLFSDTVYTAGMFKTFLAEKTFEAILQWYSEAMNVAYEVDSIPRAVADDFDTGDLSRAIWGIDVDEARTKFEEVFHDYQATEDDEEIDYEHMLVILREFEQLKEFGAKTKGMDPRQWELLIERTNEDFLGELRTYVNEHEYVDSSEFWSYDDNEQRDALPFVTANLGDHVDMSKIREITYDPSVDKGVEVITFPLTIKETFAVMEDMFKFISEYGYTSNSTGMHVNISHKNLKDRIMFDHLKLFILADPDYHQGFTRRRDRQMWSPRAHVNAMLGDGEVIVTKSIPAFLGQTYPNLKGMEAVAEFLRNTLSTTSRKFQAINSLHTRLDDIDSRRIEFRYFGGVGYEEKINILRSDIYYACFALLAAVSPGFMEKEYHQQLYRYFDKLSQKTYKMGYADLVTSIRARQNPGNLDIDLNKKISRHDRTDPSRG